MSDNKTTNWKTIIPYSPSTRIIKKKKKGTTRVQSTTTATSILTLKNIMLYIKQKLRCTDSNNRRHHSEYGRTDRPGQTILMYFGPRTMVEIEKQLQYSSTTF